MALNNNTTNASSGYNTPDSELESVLPIHPSAARRPHAIVVQSENTAYSDEYITAKYENRSAEVTVMDGQFLVNPTVQSFEFQTKRVPGKTGSVVLLKPTFSNRLNMYFPD